MAVIERGLKQRIHALNLFIDDIYHDQRILKDGVIPAGSSGDRQVFRKVRRAEPPRGIWCHITGTDLVRHCDGRSTCSRTTCAAHRACRTSCRTAR